MKFPLAQPPFPPLQLTAQQCEAYEQLAATLLQETLGEYDHFVRVQNRTLPKKHWKSVKKRENVTVYKHRSDSSTTKAQSTASTSSSSESGALCPVSKPTWSLPKMLAVGTIVGTLEDVMYGIISPDVDAIKIKTTYVQDELIDGRVLLQLKHPSADDPFQFLALKWFVKAHSASVNAVVWPRDLVFIEGTGYHRLPDGDVVGYHLLHSVALPQCPALTHLGIMRCEFSSCFLFKQQRNGTVEVYMKSHVEPGGTIPDIVAIMSSANALIGCWKSVWCAQNKKLTWMLRQQQQQQQHAFSFGGDEQQQQARRMIVRTSVDGKKCCALCVKTLAPFRRTVACGLCRTVVCNRCRTARKLTYVGRTGDVEAVATVFCKNCITQSTQLSAAEVALDESLPVGSQRPRARSKAVSFQPSVTARDSRRSQVNDGGGSSSSVPPIVLLDADVDAGELSIETIDEWEQHLSQASMSEAVPDTISSANHSEETAMAVRETESMWQQMNELWVKAELTYQLTRQNTEALVSR